MDLCPCGSGPLTSPGPQNCPPPQAARQQSTARFSPRSKPRQTHRRHPKPTAPRHSRMGRICPSYETARQKNPVGQAPPMARKSTGPLQFPGLLEYPFASKTADKASAECSQQDCAGSWHRRIGRLYVQPVVIIILRQRAANACQYAALCCSPSASERSRLLGRI